MRILRSQYLKYQTQTATVTKIQSLRNGGKQLKSETTTTETTTEASACRIRSLKPSATSSTAKLHRSSFQIPSDAITISSCLDDTDATASAPSSNCCASIISNDDIAQTKDKQHELTFQHQQQQPTTNSNSLQIRILNAQKLMSKLDVVIEFYREGPEWYSDFYRSYEGALWHKIPREGVAKYQKWYFNCHKCVLNLSSFTTLKSHLNGHMGFYPNRCEQCPKRYASTTSLRKHQIAKHSLVNFKRTRSISE